MVRMGSSGDRNVENSLDLFLFILVDNFFDLEMEKIIIHPLGGCFRKSADKISITCAVELMEGIFLVTLIVQSMMACSQQKYPQEDQSIGYPRAVQEKEKPGQEQSNCEKDSED